LKSQGYGGCNLKKNQQKLERINLVLQTIRHVNLLLIKERDRDRLLQGICDRLLKNHGYFSAWIALFDRSGKLIKAFEAGLGNELLSLVELIKSGKLTDCGQKALAQPDIVLIENPFSACTDCPLSKNYAGRGAMTIRLEYEGTTYGLLTVSIPKDLVLDDEENELIREVAGNIAFGLHTIDLEKKRKQMEHLLLIQDKMASLGRVTAGIAHEIRNPLSGINIYINTLNKIYDKSRSKEKVKQILMQLQSASNKIESVIKRVMDFSKPTEPKLALIDINKPIEDAINLSAVSLRKTGIKMEKRLSNKLQMCNADPNLIEEVILNLISNAAEAMKTMDGEKKIAMASSKKGDRILVTVSDSGPGVPSDLRDKIFDPFYTTKSDSTGIGLSLGCYI